ncbi:MAG: hypothetical protein JNK86_07205 [Alphaproteobacteria bacterium]|nr:hypothetical protein [Alphaproteobacteria bacterium]
MRTWCLFIKISFLVLLNHSVSYAQQSLSYQVNSYSFGHYLSVPSEGFEEKLLQDCGFVQSQASSLQLSCFFQEEPIRFPEIEWRQLLLFFENDGQIKSLQPTITPALNKPKVKSGDQVALLSLEEVITTLMSFDENSFKLELVNNNHNTIKKLSLGSIVGEPIDAINLDDESIVVLTNYIQNLSQDIEDYRTYGLMKMDRQGKILWNTQDKFMGQLWQGFIEKFPKDEALYGFDFLLKPVQKQIVVASFRNWPEAKEGKYVLGNGLFLSCYQKDGTFQGNIVLPDATINQQTIKLDFQDQIVAAWLKSDTRVTEKNDAFFLGRWPQDCSANTALTSVNIDVPNHFPDWQMGNNTYVKAIQPVKNGHTFILYVQQRAEVHCLKLTGRPCSSQKIFAENMELLRPGLFLMEVSQSGKVLGVQPIISPDSPSGWLLAVVRGFQYEQYNDFNVTHGIDIGMTVTPDQQNLVIFLMNPLAATVENRKAQQPPESVLLVYRIQLKP